MIFFTTILTLLVIPALYKWFAIDPGNVKERD